MGWSERNVSIGRRSAPSSRGIGGYRTIRGHCDSHHQGGKAVGVGGSGKIIFKFPSGAFAQLAGKTFKLSVKPIGPNRFEQEHSD
jgi:hypothetical protein